MRREFLKKLPLLGLVALPTVSEAKYQQVLPVEPWGTLKEIEDAILERTKIRFDYKGYHIRWTGYKCAQDTDRVVGQWVAVHRRPHVKDDLFYYASTTMFTGEQLYRWRQEELKYQPARRGDMIYLPLGHPGPENTKQEMVDSCIGAMRALIHTVDLNAQA